MTTQTRHINIEVPPKLFEHYQATEKRSYQYKMFTLEIIYYSTYCNFKLLSLPRQSLSTIKIIGLSYLGSLKIGFRLIHALQCKANWHVRTCGTAMDGGGLLGTTGGSGTL